MKKHLPGLAISFCLLFGTPVSHAANPDAETPVFLNYTQETLDHNYNQAGWAPNIKQLLQRYDARSNITRERLGEPEHLSYGDTKNETLDLFRSKQDNAPAHIFIHGGAWRAGSASSYHFPAEMFVDSGVNYIGLNFDTVQDVGLNGMLSQLRKAIQWAYTHSDKLGIDKNKIYISGHSSGGHLGGVLLTTDWSEYNLPADVIKGATLISGMYDLKPVRLSARSSYVPFTDAIEDTMSTQRHLEKISTPVILAYGGLETDEFKRQTRSFHDALKAAEKPTELIFMDDYNHFEIMDDFGNPYNPIAKAALKQALGN